MELEKKRLATVQFCKTNASCTRELECRDKDAGKTWKFNKRIFTKFGKALPGKIYV